MSGNLSRHPFSKNAPRSLPLSRCRQMSGTQQFPAPRVENGKDRIMNDDHVREIKRLLAIVFENEKKIEALETLIEIKEKQKGKGGE